MEKYAQYHEEMLTMNHNTSPAHEPEVSRSQAANATHILDLPNPLLNEVAMRLTTENPVETAESIANFNKTHPSMREATRTQSFERFQGRLKELSGAVKALFHAVRRAPTLPDGDGLNADQLAHMRAEVAYRPALGGAYTNHAQPLDQPQSSHLDRKIEEIDDKVFSVAEDIMFNDISAHEVMPRIRPIARLVKESHDSGERS
ncbi:hypothetical protein AJ87_49350 [Rhizobium yanglingense]|nr:hypothetical protein AJ87_49350 [Rhizobium yanglingense]